VKSLSAILSSLLLVWTQLSAAPMPVTLASPIPACCHCGGRMSCCPAPSSGSQPTPVVPSSIGLQKQLLISAPAVLAGILPENRTGLMGSASRWSLTSAGAPLYARDCARLI